MTHRLRRLRPLWLPVLGLACALGIASACSSSEPTPASDAGADGATAPDAPVAIDATTDAPPADGGVDSPKEAAVPPFCVTYKDLSADASAVEGPRRLYELIALRALVEAMSSCEIGMYFDDIEDPPPSLITCMGKQLAMVAGCNLGGAPIDYSKEIDENGIRCVPSVGSVGNAVQMGFRNPSSTPYAPADVDFMLELVRKAAESTGIPPADAAKLRALFASQRVHVTDGGVEAGPDASFSNSTCP